MGKVVVVKSLFGGEGYCTPLATNQGMQRALAAYLQNQTNKEGLLSDLDPYDLPPGLYEGHLVQLAMDAEPLLGLQEGECSIVQVLAVWDRLFPTTA